MKIDSGTEKLEILKVELSLVIFFREVVCVNELYTK